MKTAPLYVHSIDFVGQTVAMTTDPGGLEAHLSFVHLLKHFAHDDATMRRVKFRLVVDEPKKP